VRTGIAASDPSILPVGSVVNISTHDVKYNGVYTIMDTGPAVQGRTLDLYMWSCHEALRFGRRPVELRVLRLGWNPAASTPSFVDRLFRRREEARVRPQAPPQPSPTDAQHEDATQQAPVHTDHTDQAVGSAGESATPAVPATPLLNTP
jgi:3D domain